MSDLSKIARAGDSIFIRDAKNADSLQETLNRFVKELSCMLVSSDPEMVALAEKARLLILGSNCFDRTRNWVDMDYIWYDPEVLSDFTDVLTEILEILRRDLRFNKLVLPDKVVGPYGILPVFILVSQQLDPPVPFVIWKEMARPASGESQLYGKLADEDRLLLVHDVINYGMAITQMINDLGEFRKERKMRFTINGILSIVDRELNGAQFIKENSRIEPMVMFLVSSLRDQASEG